MSWWKKKLLLNLNIKWEIALVSVNSMYFIDKDWNFCKTSKAKEYQERIQQRAQFSLLSSWRSVIKTPIDLEIDFSIQTKRKKDWEFYSGRRDVDNLLKATLDWLTWRAIKDDSYIYRMIVNVKPSDNPTFFTFNLYEYKQWNPNDYQIFMDIPYIYSYNSWYTAKLWKIIKTFYWKQQTYDKILKPEVHKYKEAISKFLTKFRSDYINTYHNKNLTLKVWLFFPETSFYERDIDNPIKFIQDAITWILFEDDSQIKTLIVEKFISNTSKIGISIIS